jgi:MFS family permease
MDKGSGGFSKYIPEGFKNIFRSLRYKNYRYFFYGQSISLIGTWMQRIATPWLVYKITGSVYLLGVVGFAGQIPTFLIAPFAGVIVDRFNRYKILVLTQVLAMIQALILAYLVLTNSIQVWEIVLLSISLGIINAFDMPSRQSLIVDMIDKREDLGNAIALNSSMVSSARVLGPSIAGIIIALTGEGTCFLLNAISYIFVIAFLLLIKITPRKIKPQNTHVYKGFIEGFKYTFGFMPMRYVILLLALISFMGMPYTVLMPVFAKNILHGGSHTFGFLMGAAGIGALCGSIYMASRKSVIGLSKIIALAAAIFGFGLCVFSLSNFFLLSLGLMLIVGLGFTLQMASCNTLLQTIVDDDKRGRVMSLYAMAFMGTAPFGSYFAGFMASIIGAPYTLLFGGVSCIIGAIVFARKLPKIKMLIHPIYVKMGIITEDNMIIYDAAELTNPDSNKSM